MERKTYSPKKPELHVEREWYIVDAEGQTLGRLASVIAQKLRGKDKPIFAPHMDTGDFVIVINAEKVAVSGKKETQKIYYRHSGYPGGLKATALREVRAKHPERILKAAVRGMLPRNQVGEEQLRKLRLYVGPDHPHAAQNPKPLHLDPSIARL